MYPKSENLMRRWISLLRSGPQDELAEALSHLAVLHIAMGEIARRKWGCARRDLRKGLWLNKKPIRLFLSPLLGLGLLALGSYAMLTSMR
jgi:hypothetical protein